MYERFNKENPHVTCRPVYSSFSHLVRTPFCIAGTAIQSALCLVPCVLTNTLDAITKHQHEVLNSASKSSLNFFSHGISSNFEKNFFQNPWLAYNKNFYVFSYSDLCYNEFNVFLDNPSLFLDDQLLNEPYFLDEKLSKKNLDKMLSSPTIPRFPRIGKINVNEILYFFAFNCMTYNLLSDINIKFPGQILNKELFDNLSVFHNENITKFKRHIREICNVNYQSEDFQSKLQNFFDVCENYFGKLDVDQSSIRTGRINSVSILDYHSAKLKCEEDLRVRNSSLLPSNRPGTREVMSLSVAQPSVSSDISLIVPVVRH